MNLKIAKMICKYQRINMKIRIRGKCPICGKKSLIMMVEQNKAKCSLCHKTWTMMELLKLCEEDELEKHRRAFWESKTNKGVEQ
ncbi:MAG: hypothetical protein ACOCRO_11585 [Halanaerobiales bacterium]